MIKVILIILFLLTAGFFMVNSIELHDPEDECEEGDLIEVIDGIWSCSPSSSVGNLTSLINNAICPQGYVLQNVTINETGLTGYCVLSNGTAANLTDTTCSVNDSCATIVYWSDVGTCGDGQVLSSDGLSLFCVDDEGTDAGYWLLNGVITSPNISTGALIVNSSYIISDFETNITGDELRTGNLSVSSLLNCDTIDTDSNGNFKCGSDASGGSGSGDGGGWINTSTTTSTALDVNTTGNVTVNEYIISHMNSSVIIFEQDGDVVIRI